MGGCDCLSGLGEGATMHHYLKEEGFNSYQELMNYIRKGIKERGEVK